MTKRKIAISQPSVGEEEWLALREPLETGWLTQGPKVAEFEQAFAARHRVSHAVATTSCTTALHLALQALGVGPGDEVIVPAFTWIATANAVVYCGATPVLVDVDRVTYNIDVSALEMALSERTRAVVPVHLFGLCADVDAIRSVLPSEVKLVEDAACAAGAEYRGRMAGSLGDVGCFSFHPRKSITTGEGGMITTHSAELAETIAQMRNHGASISEEVRHKGPRPHILPEFEVLGYNYRMTDLQAAVGVVQLSKLDSFIDERAKWASWYADALADLSWIRPPSEPEAGRHAWQAFVCWVDDDAPAGRDDLMDELERLGISTRPGTHAIHTLAYYRDRFGYKYERYPNAAASAARSLAVPLHNQMTEDDFIYVAEAIHRVGR